MKSTYILITILFISFNQVFSQAAKIKNKNEKHSYPVRTLTIEPAIGWEPYPVSDVIVSNVIQWNVKKKLGIISHTSYTRNNAFLRKFNYIETNYNYSLSQKFGIGTSVYSRKLSHTFSLLGGIKYDTYKETLNNPSFEKYSMSISSLSPDFGLMYNLKIGKKKCFFSYRMYLPLYPYPVKGYDFSTFDGNMANISVEVGIGIRIK